MGRYFEALADQMISEDELKEVRINLFAVNLSIMCLLFVSVRIKLHSKKMAGSLLTLLYTFLVAKLGSS